MLPFTERKQSIMQSHDKIRQFKYHQSGSSQLSVVTQGSKVCLRSSPVYSAGGKAIHMKGTQLQCGILQSSIISPTLSEKCSFKVISGTTVPAVTTASVAEGSGREEGEVEEEGMDQQTAEVDTVRIGMVLH